METERSPSLILEKIKKIKNLEPIDEPKIINATPEEYYRGETVNESKRETNVSSQNTDVEKGFQEMVIVEIPELYENFKETKHSKEASTIPTSEQIIIQTTVKHIRKDQGIVAKG